MVIEYYVKNKSENVDVKCEDYDKNMNNEMNVVEKNENEDFYVKKMKEDIK